MSMSLTKCQRWWENGVLIRELAYGVEVVGNIGKTPTELGLDIPNGSIPRDQWPLWAKALSQFSKPKDRGIGDVVARMIGDEKSEKFKAWYLVTFGKPCGCNGRQKQWNTKYPLNLKAT